MIEASEKSTATVGPIDRAEVANGVWLDGRLALFHEAGNWLCVSDIHYGYEVSRQAAGGLWPDWGRAAVEERLQDLISEYSPETLIFAGDVVDSSVGGSDAVAFLSRMVALVPRTVLVAGNHDRGAVRREFDWVEDFEIDGFLFHHGHRTINSDRVKNLIEVVGHHHPSAGLHDGAGLTLRVPALIQESYEDRAERWVLPAFSPWAGGGQFRPAERSVSHREWVCSAKRVFESTGLD
ncbi:MAG: hypothetical protein HKN23_03150 [Verrucomicrobiales bacterium]|nr:hypothetical protein [Verrucomicrobiales bacterium]